MSHSNITVTDNMLSRMEEKILKNRPQLQQIKNAYGSRSYFDYVKQKNRVNPHKHFRERIKEVIQVIKEETAGLLGTAIADSVEEQLKRNNSMSTAEHSAPIGTAHMLNAGLHVSIPLFGSEDPKLQNLIILSCSGVSFNNVLSFSRGLSLHLLKGQEVTDAQVTLFGRSLDPKTVLYYPPYTKESLAEAQKRLYTLHKEGSMSGEVLEKIDTLLKGVYSTPHVYTGKDYVDQLTISNHFLWKKLFPSFIKSTIPNYIMLSQEKILLKLLLNYHLDSDTPIHRMLFDSNYHRLLEKYFEGLIGAFKNDRSSGTFLFWGMSKDNIRMQLFREGNKLVSLNGEYSLPLEPNAVRAAIENKEIMPSLMLTFTVFSFYYGLLLGGGASQPTYLTQMKKSYADMMKELGDMESVQDSEEAVTDDFVFFRPHLAFVDFAGERISATGLDMYLYQEEGRFKQIINATKSITISEFITILLPILYKQFCPEEEREENLMQIGRQDVERHTGFDTKLPSLGTIK